jgi:hypothetical protein
VNFYARFTFKLSPFLAWLLYDMIFKERLFNHIVDLLHALFESEINQIMAIVWAFNQSKVLNKM